MARIKPKQDELYLKAFLIALGIAFLFFIPFLIMDKGYFLFYGDFDVQQVPFYKLAHSSVRSGDVFWNWNTDLGVNFVGSYSFYMLGSPFFWLTLPFPTEFLPHLMGPLLILKFACSSLTAYCFLRRFTKTPDAALLGGLLYAFSGFSVYNIFFNHFHEAIVLFPLLLLGLEMYMADNRKGVFALAVFFCALNNYYFFAGMAIFTFIYWLLRMLSGAWKMTLPRFLWLAFEVAAGCLLAAIILAPSYLSVTQNPRTNYRYYGWDAFVYRKPQLFANIIEVFFFPPDLPARPVFFGGTDEKWASLAGWLPLFGMTGVFTYLFAKKGTWLRRIIAVLALMALVPILNSAFMLFNSSYYARWFYMPVLMMALATAVAAEDPQCDWKKGWRWTAVITGLTVLAVGFFPSQYDGIGALSKVNFFSAEWFETFRDHFGIYVKDLSDRFWVTCAIALISLAIMAVLIPLIKKSRKTFIQFSTIAVICVSIIYSVYFVGMGKTHGYETTGHIIPDLLETKVVLKDSDNYRVDVYEGMDNTAMFFGLPTIQAFHSIVPVSIMDFYDYIDVERSVGSRPEVSHEAIRPLLSVKYLLDYVGDDENFTEDAETKMSGYEFYETQGNYDIYENKNYIPYGFTYDYYMNAETAEQYGQSNRENMMLKAILLNSDQITKYRSILKPFNETTDSKYYKEYTDSNYEYTNGEYPETLNVPQEADFYGDSLSEDAAARRAESAHYFKRDNRGFTSKIKLSKDNLVFYSVPYEDGWSATVNGRKVEIEKVNMGFMAVKAGAGENEIRFTYTTPLLKEGAILSFIGALLLAGYIIGWKLYKSKNTEEFDRQRILAAGSFEEISSYNLTDPEDVARALSEINAASAAEAEPEFDGGFKIAEEDFVPDGSIDESFGGLFNSSLNENNPAPNSGDKMAKEATFTEKDLENKGEALWDDTVDGVEAKAEDVHEAESAAEIIPESAAAESETTEIPPAGPVSMDIPPEFKADE